MKKLMTILAIAMATSFAMAQKTTWITQSGTSNIATVSQDAAISGDALAIYAVQSGTYNSLTTNQLGYNNYIELKQTNNLNTASMTQLTPDATVAPGGVNNADILQSGNSNTASLIQKELNGVGGTNMDFSKNTVHATQSGNYNTYSLVQGAIPWEPTNASYLLESGNNNVAGITQNGYTNYSEINQSGNINTAYLVQNDAAMNSVSIWDKSYSWQTGGSNYLNVFQNGNPGLQYAESAQDGTSNSTIIKQLSWGPQNVVATQHGTGDQIQVTQSN